MEWIQLAQDNHKLFLFPSVAKCLLGSWEQYMCRLGALAL